MDDAIKALLGHVEEERQRFSDRPIPLSEGQVKAIQRFSAYLAETTVSRNYYKKRTFGLLRDLWTHISEVFILCALATYPSKLGPLDTTKCFRELLKWWEGVDQPEGLTWVLKHYAHILPDGSGAASPQSCLPQKRQSETAASNGDENGRNKQPQRVKTSHSKFNEITAEEVGQFETSVGDDRKMSIKSVENSLSGPMYEGGDIDQAGLGPGAFKAGGMRVAVMPDLEKLPQILGHHLFHAMQASSVRTKEKEEDRREGKAPRKVTNGVHLCFADKLGEDFTLLVKLGFDPGRKIWFEAFPKV